MFALVLFVCYLDGGCEDIVVADNISPNLSL
ncbi:DUF1482 family protein, partial [Escherichia coli]